MPRPRWEQHRARPLAAVARRWLVTGQGGQGCSGGGLDRERVCYVVVRVQRLPPPQQLLPRDVLWPMHAWWRLTAGREGR